MVKLARRVVDCVARAFDIVLFRASSRQAWPEDDFSAQLFAKLSPDCVFDVGANAGQYAQRLRDSGLMALSSRSSRILAHLALYKLQLQKIRIGIATRSRSEPSNQH